MTSTAPFRQPASDAALIAPSEPPPFEVVNPDGRAPLVLVCDHASPRVPAAFGDLGLAAASFDLHIAYDIGAAEVARRLAARLDAPAVLARYSRLLIDLNRSHGHATLIPPVSDGVPVPGNAALTDADRQRRIETFFEPYHAVVAATVARRLAAVPVVFGVHSFTPRMNGFDRPWHVGVLSDRDRRVADPLLAALGAEPGLTVGDNEPYSGRDVGYTLDRHAATPGLPHASVEIRQNEVADPAGIARWADIMERALKAVLAVPGLHAVSRA